MTTPPTFSVGQTLTSAAMNSVGLWLVTSATGTATNRVAISNCFTSDFDNYKVIVQGLSTSSGDNLSIRFSISGTDTSSATYQWQRIETNASSSTSISGTSTTAISPSYTVATAGTRNNLEFDVFGPQTANITSIFGQAARLDSGSNLYSISFAGSQLTNTSQFDGISIIGGAGNITCKVYVYGYRK